MYIVRGKNPLNGAQLARIENRKLRRRRDGGGEEMPSGKRNGMSVRETAGGSPYAAKRQHV